MVIIKLRNWIIPFKLARLLVTHDDRKLIRVGELSLAERLQGRQGIPLARVTLALSLGYPSEGNPSCLVNTCKKEEICECQGNPLARVTLGPDSLRISQLKVDSFIFCFMLTIRVKKRYTVYSFSRVIVTVFKEDFSGFF